MADKIEILSRRINFQFAMYRKPLSIDTIQSLTADLYPSHDMLSIALNDLKTRGLIKLEGEVILPVDNEGIVRFLENDDNHTVKSEGILKVLSILGQGTPDEIGRAYLKFIDSQVNVESVTRILRFMFKAGRVSRKDDVYFTEEKPTKSLGEFA
jgi:hypothetical protein